MKRRTFLKDCAGLATSAGFAGTWPPAAQAQAADASQTGGAIVLEPKPLFEISPHLYMQFICAAEARLSTWTGMREA